MARVPYKRKKEPYWQVPGSQPVRLKPTTAYSVEIGEDVTGILHITVDKNAGAETLSSFARHIRKNLKLPKG